MVPGRYLAKVTVVQLARHPWHCESRRLSLYSAASLFKPLINRVAGKICGDLAKSYEQSILKLPYKRGAYVARAEDRELTAAFKELFKDAATSKRTRVIIIHGPEGSGKSVSAGNLAWGVSMWLWGRAFHLRKNIPLWSITKAPIVRWTLDASNKKTLFDGYSDLANQLKLPAAKKANNHNTMCSRTSLGRQYHNETGHHVRPDTSMDNALDDISSSVMERLDEESGFVLIVDGANHESAGLAKYWPRGGDLRKAESLVIITTQDPNAFVGGNEHGHFEKKVSVGKMQDSDALKLLEECITGNKPIQGREEACARDIVGLLDGNPQDIAA